VEISARCIRQTGVTEGPWILNLKLSPNREVQRAFCSCPAGAEGWCKHMAALVLFINTERTESKTDKACSFQAPSQLGKSRYPKGQEFDTIFKLKNAPPKVTFLNISNDAKKKLYELMLKNGNTASPLFKICAMKVNIIPSCPPSRPSKV
jgi:hypothetical protein